ncbi:NADH-quinone oxidoreductase subunit L [Undibacterium oligocarboniphilum]|uniref:Probable inorganic carbon transporter subunit DabB n=1 Tax=Undibacterium oligocarboniphilum TaxID=666702 RepID=A0A850QIM8_9BURK|nr:NADH-quinone oxidoreductase subunit L [Undibacterium oligocarboniphilum]MBC3871862.1 NADH-quinone oxidoreductase subunit L [Undibacterium oligocarboniphilum]NVO79431.1 NADH-quinone oxidoreductase subunit L [Undibacterium oligocarboniphilum]
MDIAQVLFWTSALAPVALMVTAALLTPLRQLPTAGLWRAFQALSVGALAFTVISVCVGPSSLRVPASLQASSFGLILAILVQLLGTVIGGFSARYLQGEAAQRRYVSALATVLAAVHLLLMADHWLVLIAAWALVGVALQHLLCFYPDRAFARLAAHKKRIADRLADGLLMGAAGLAWVEVGSGSLSALWMHVAREGMSTSLQLSALALVLAVVLRTALLPVHGWLIQVMEAPTPISALLHAGVVNLGGFVLIRFAPLLEQAAPARWLLMLLGLASAVLAGMVMLTRISIKVRLAWSTVAQMGFMLLECALGLYTLAALHLIGHSLYKAHAFLSASTVVRQTRQQALHCRSSPTALSLALAPVLTISVVLLILSLYGHASWPWWWSAVLGLAWAPLLWLPAARAGLPARVGQALFGLLMVIGLTATAMVAHSLPLGIQDTPHRELGLIALFGMAALYLCVVLLQLRPRLLSNWRRWSYAGFYLDEAYTRMALRLWPARWMPESFKHAEPEAAASPLANAPQ